MYHTVVNMCHCVFSVSIMWGLCGKNDTVNTDLYMSSHTVVTVSSICQLCGNCVVSEDMKSNSVTTL